MKKLLLLLLLSVCAMFAQSGGNCVSVTNGVTSWSPCIIGGSGSTVYGLNINQSPGVTAWGDSLTQGNQDNTGNTWPWYFQNLTGRATNNYGISGQTSTQITARFVNNPQLWNNYAVIWSGRNNLVQATILANIATMVSSLPSPKRFVVLGLINNESEPSGSANYNTIIAINAALAATYPSNYIDIRTLLISQYNPANTMDVADHTADIVPYTTRALDNSGTLTSAITDTTSCPAVSKSLSPQGSSAGYIIKVDSEYINVLTISGLTVLTCNRGYGGSTAVTHSNAAAYTLTDYEHIGSNNGTNGELYIAQQVQAFVTAHDPMAGSKSGFLFNFPLVNLGFGDQALTSISTGTVNTAIGISALLNLTTASGNTALGYFAGVTSNNANADTTGADNTFLGFQSGFSSSTQQSFMSILGASATAACSNCIVLGRSGAKDVVLLNSSFTFATLPAAASYARACTWITDGAASPVFMANAAGGGAVQTLVCSDGTNWTNH